jgi:DUF1009 family protein
VPCDHISLALYSCIAVLTHEVSDKADTSASIVVSRCMGALDVPSSALVHGPCATHAEAMDQGHRKLNVWALKHCCERRIVVLISLLHAQQDALTQYKDNYHNYPLSIVLSFI